MPHLDPFRPMIFQWKPQRDRISQLAMFNYRRINWSDLKCKDLRFWGFIPPLLKLGIVYYWVLTSWISMVFLFCFFLESIPGVGAVAMTVRSCVSRSYWCLPCTTAEVPLKNVEIDLTQPALLIWLANPHKYVYYASMYGSCWFKLPWFAWLWSGFTIWWWIAIFPQICDVFVSPNDLNKMSHMSLSPPNDL